MNRQNYRLIKSFTLCISVICVSILLTACWSDSSHYTEDDDYYLIEKYMDEMYDPYWEPPIESYPEYSFDPDWEPPEETYPDVPDEWLEEYY